MNHYYCGIEVDARDEEIERLEAEIADIRRTHLKLDVDVEALREAVTMTDVGELVEADWRAVEVLYDLACQVLSALDGIDEYHCLTHACEMYDEGLCGEQMARLYHETGGNSLSGLLWVNEQYGECRYPLTCSRCDGTGAEWDGSFYLFGTTCKKCNGSGLE